MAVLRKEKKNNFTVIDNAIFKDSRISFKAKGLLCQMLSLPDGWEYSVKGLAALASDKYSAITSGLKELEEAGYFRREQRFDHGKFAGYEYIISEIPHEKNSDFTFSENPISENTISGNPTQLNTKESNTKESTTNKSIGTQTRKRKNLHTDKSIRPTIEQIKDYIAEKNLNVDAQRFYDFFDAGEWIDSKGEPVRSWKQKLITWSDQNERKGNNYRRGDPQRRSMGTGVRTADTTHGTREADWSGFVPAPSS